jgi:hypothetical protein
MAVGVVCGTLVHFWGYVWTKKNLATLLPLPLLPSLSTQFNLLRKLFFRPFQLQSKNSYFRRPSRVSTVPSALRPLLWRRPSHGKLKFDGKDTFKKSLKKHLNFLGQCLYFSFSTVKQCILSILMYTQPHCCVLPQTFYLGGIQTQVFCF